MYTRPETHLRAGQALGAYQLLRPLDQRTITEIWLARQRVSHEQVALKVLLGDGLETREWLALAHCLANEARMLAVFRHPHIVGYHGYRTARATRSLVIQYAPYGSTAKYHPAGQQLALALTRVYAWQIGLALYELHQRGLIHRDVKPDNILLVHRSHALLADFGLAMLQPGTSARTQPAKGGTVAYMPLEQYAGYPCAASDQYSLAVCVYEWLTGDIPFYGDAAQLMRRRERLEPLPIRRFRPELPAALDEVILTALQHDPARRYPDVMTFVRKLMEVTRAWRVLPRQMPDLPDWNAALALSKNEHW